MPFGLNEIAALPADFLDHFIKISFRDNLELATGNSEEPFFRNLKS